MDNKMKRYVIVVLMFFYSLLQANDVSTIDDTLSIEYSRGVSASSGEIYMHIKLIGDKNAVSNYGVTLGFPDMHSITMLSKTSQRTKLYPTGAKIYNCNLNENKTSNYPIIGIYNPETYGSLYLVNEELSIKVLPSQLRDAYDMIVEVRGYIKYKNGKEKHIPQIHSKLYPVDQQGYSSTNIKFIVQ